MNRERVSRVFFGCSTVLWRCAHCNTNLEITELVERCREYGLMECPPNLYQAWKILRLGTSEYAEGEMEHTILKAAVVAASGKEMP
ncbi:hypothetical protein LCGC14_1491830 [marine sediment metagenome]|uniref:Uncharacterized protein n=1 Tax=marine sediment metagenome TaxID=412755 RepID=A0A0F9J791_9ZZZZ